MRFWQTNGSQLQSCGAALLSKSYCQGSGGSNPHLETMDVPEPLEDPETSRRHPPWAWLQRSQTGELKWWKARLEPTKDLLPGSSDFLMIFLSRALSGPPNASGRFQTKQHLSTLAIPVTPAVPWLTIPVAIEECLPGQYQRMSPLGCHDPILNELLRTEKSRGLTQAKHLHPLNFKQVSHPFEVARNGKRGT